MSPALIAACDLMYNYIFHPMYESHGFMHTGGQTKLTNALSWSFVRSYFLA